MQFREFINAESQFYSFFERVKAFVLKSLEKNNDGIHLSFPPNYESLMPQTIPLTSFMPQPMALAAGTVNPGNKFNEYTAKEKIDYGMKKLAGTWFTQSLDDPERFKSKLAATGRYIATDMGIMFESGVFIYFVTKQNLAPMGSKSLEWALQQQQEHLKNIAKHGGKWLADAVQNFVRYHAEDLGAAILKHATSLSQCPIDTVEFVGGNHAGTYRQTADITLSCRKQNTQLGYSVKFASEALVRVADMRSLNVYTLFGGDEADSLREALADMDDNDEKVGFILSELKPLAQKIVSEKPPTMLNYIINRLISGTDPEDNMAIGNTFPAVKNWTTNRATPAFAESLKQFFKINPRAKGAKLKIRPDATPTFRITGSRITFYISSPETSDTRQFKLEFQVENNKDNVVIKMNHMA